MSNSSAFGQGREGLSGDGEFVTIDDIEEVSID
jgi:hypothetical protein